MSMPIAGSSSITGDFSLDITLSQGSMKRILAFEHYATLLEFELMGAMYESVTLLEEYVYRDMWATFMNPQGPLEDSLGYDVVSPYEAWMGSDSPYARRRDRGFSGMMDALGRFYPYDPGIEWAESAVLANVNKVKWRFNAALRRTAAGLEAAGGGTP